MNSFFCQNKFIHTSSGRVPCRQLWRKVWCHEDKKLISGNQARQGTAAVIWCGLCRVRSLLSGFSQSLWRSELNYFSLRFIFTGKKGWALPFPISILCVWDTFRSIILALEEGHLHRVRDFPAEERYMLELPHSKENLQLRQGCGRGTYPHLSSM